MKKFALTAGALGFGALACASAFAHERHEHHKCRKGYVATESGQCVKPKPQ